MKIGFILVSIFTLLHACCTPKTTVQTTEVTPPITNQTENMINLNATWEVEQISAYPNTTAIKPYFTISGNQINGHTGCNTFGGVITVTDPKIEVGNLMMTKMFCTETAELEQQFMTALGQVVRFQINHHELLFFDADYNLVMLSVLKTDENTQKNTQSLHEDIVNGRYVLQYNLSGRRFTETWTYQKNRLEVIATVPEILKKEVTADKTMGKNMTQLISAWDLNELEQLIPPSKAHQYDGAFAASLKLIVGDKTFVVPTFDDGNPPAYIKEVIDELRVLRDNE